MRVKGEFGVSTGDRYERGKRAARSEMAPLVAAVVLAADALVDAFSKPIYEADSDFVLAFRRLREAVMAYRAAREADDRA